MKKELNPQVVLNAIRCTHTLNTHFHDIHFEDLNYSSKLKEKTVLTEIDEPVTVSALNLQSSMFVLMDEHDHKTVYPLVETVVSHFIGSTFKPVSACFAIKEIQKYLELKKDAIAVN